jgi:hypothetical protein
MKKYNPYYKEIIKLDNEIEKIEEFINEFTPRSGKYNVKFEYRVNHTLWFDLDSWHDKKIIVDIMGEIILKKYQEERKNLIKKRDKLINYKWYKFWLS